MCWWSNCRLRSRAWHRNVETRMVYNDIKWTAPRTGQETVETVETAARTPAIPQLKLCLLPARPGAYVRRIGSTLTFTQHAPCCRLMPAARHRCRKLSFPIPEALVHVTITWCFFQTNQHIAPPTLLARDPPPKPASSENHRGGVVAKITGSEFEISHPPSRIDPRQAEMVIFFGDDKKQTCR